MKKPTKLSLLLILILFVVPLAYAARVERLIDTWQPKHYLVNITLNDQLSELSATTRIDIVILKPTTLIDFDFGDLSVDAVTLDSKPASFTHKDGKLKINLAQPARPGTRSQISIQYHGKPKDGLILTNDKDSKPSAIGDNWPNRVHHWIPSLDHPSAKATVTFNITAPASNEVVANGRFDRVDPAGASNTRTWTYSESVPIPPYCMVIAVGQFKVFKPTERTVTPLSYYVPHSDAPTALKGFAPTNPSLVFFSETIAPYPYEKLAMIVGTTRYGGMENSGAIVFSSTLFDPRPQATLSKTYGIPQGIATLIAHEIAHQWFGDAVTESTWADLWLSEGFATYFAGLFLQRYESEEAFQTYMKNAANQVFEYEKKSRTPIFDRDTEDLLDMLNPNSYQKGAWVLHMLRSSLGDDAFFRGIRNYYRTYASTPTGGGAGTATTEDLRAVLEKTSGRNLRAFFARWIYDSGHPQYELSWQWQRNRDLRLVLKQVQPGNPFLDHVPITIRTASGTRDVILKPVGKTTTTTIPSREQPLGVELDLRNTLLKEAKVTAVKAAAAGA